MKRSYVDELVDQIDNKVMLKGWVHNKRDMGQIAFIDVRDRTGLVQVVVGDDIKQPKLGPEYVVEVHGKVVKRGERYINKNIATGEIEVQVTEIKVLRESLDPPFEIRKDTAGVNEEVRLKYRYLDLRTDRMRKNMDLRYRVLKSIRDFLHNERFIEIETPTLTKGTPEGAREFLVPSRLHEGKFYVLPQSPQQFKQLLMVAGVDRYFQIAHCYRDEDQRGDRQPEFTQLDLEMSFVDQEDILDVIERLMINMVKEVAPEKKLTFDKFPRLTYAEAMKKYDSDKPDLRKNKDDPDEIAFAWIVDIPLFEKDAQGNMTSSHHPFTMPNRDDIDKLDKDPFSVRAYAYDLVMNGFEAAGGSIRIHEKELQHKIFELLGLEEKSIKAKFGHMLEAFEYGAPPHGGIAPGIDRIVMILANEPNIREVMAFPKTGDARDPMMEAPSEIEAKRLREAHIKLDLD